MAVCLRHVLCPPNRYAVHRLGAKRCSRRAAFTDKSGYHPCEQGRPRALSPTGQRLHLRIGDANEGTGAAPYQRGYEDARPRPHRGGTRSRGPVARDPLEPTARGNAARKASTAELSRWSTIPLPLNRLRPSRKGATRRSPLDLMPLMDAVVVGQAGQGVVANDALLVHRMTQGRMTVREFGRKLRCMTPCPAMGL